MNYHTPTLTLIDKLTQALGELASECESNDYFAHKHRSEIEALNAANEIRDEAAAFLKSAADSCGNDIALRTTLEDWDHDRARAPHHVQVTVSDASIDVAIWPVESGDEPEGGLSVVIEVNQGLPAMHLGPANNEQTGMHVHAHPDGTIAFTRDSKSDAWETAACRVYPSAQANSWKP